MIILNTKKTTYKVMVLLLLLCFCSNNVWAMPGLGIEINVPRETPSFLQIEIPSDIASIEEIYEAPAQENPKLILHVQNIHGNYESQVKIKKLLEYLYDKYGFKLIFAEGAVNKLNPELLNFYPEMEANVKLADSMTKNGRLTGIEYFLVDGPRDVEAVGIEETALYRKDYQAFRKVYAVKSESEAYLNLFEGKLETLASRIFSSNTRRLLSEWRKFEDGHRDFLPYVKRLTIDAKSVLGLDLESLFAQVEWPQISRLLALQTMEKDLDETAAQKEKERLLKFLEEQQVAPEIGEAIHKLHERKITVTRTDDAEKRLEDLPRYLFERLAREAGPKGFRFHDYPAFSLWAGHLILQNELDSKLLFEEIDRVFTKVLDEMTVTEREKNLMELYRDEVLLKKLLHLELTRKEWERVVYRKDWIDLRPMVGRLKKLSEEYDAGKEPADIWARLGEGVQNAQVEAVRKAIETGLEFYDLARQREDVFYNRISSEMETKKIDKAVVVTGGFHTEGLMDIFREKEINCSVLMPRIAGDLSTDEYISTMMETKPVMFDLATIEAMPFMDVLDQIMLQHRETEDPEERAYAVALALQDYFKNIPKMKDAATLGSFLNHFNEGLFAAVGNANVRLEFAQNGSESIWIRYQGTLVSDNGTIVEIPYTVEENGEVTVQSHVEPGPEVDTIPADVMTLADIEEAAGELAETRSEIRMRDRMTRREMGIRTAVFGLTALLFPDIVPGQAPAEAESAEQKKQKSAAILRIMNIAKYYKLDDAGSPLAENFKEINAESDLVFGKDINPIFTDFSWRALIMSIAKQLSAEGFDTDRVLTQEEVGKIAAQLQKVFNVPAPLSLKLGDDREKQRTAKNVVPGAGRRQATANIKELKKLGLENFQSLLQPTLDHDELISQAARALVKVWLAPADQRAQLFKDVPKEKVPADTDTVIERDAKYVSLVEETFFFAKGIPNTEEEKAAYAETLLYWAENIVKINEVASTSVLPKTKTIYDPKNYYPGKNRLIYLFTKEDALALVNSWTAQNNRINIAGAIQELVLRKITYDQAERVTVDITRSAFDADKAPQKALVEKIALKADVPELQGLILALAKNEEIEGILKLLPKDERELGESADKRKFFEDLKTSVAGDDWKALGRFLRDSKIDSETLYLKLEVTYRKGKRNAKGEKEQPSFAAFAKSIKAAENLAQLRKAIEDYRFMLISPGQIAWLTRSYGNTAQGFANEYTQKIGTITLSAVLRNGTVNPRDKDRRAVTTDENLVLTADKYRNTPAETEANFATNFLIHNGGLIWKRSTFELIYAHVYGPGYGDLYGPARSRALETLLAINPTAVEDLNPHILTPRGPGAKDLFISSLETAFDNAINNTIQSYDQNDPQRNEKAAAARVRVEKLVETAPKSAVRREIRQVIAAEGVQFAIGDNGDAVIAGTDLMTKIGQFTEGRLVAYVDRTEDDANLRALLDTLNSQEFMAEVEAGVDPTLIEAVRASLEKLAGILTAILKDAEARVKPKVPVAPQPAQGEPEIVTEEEMAEAVRVGIDVLRHFLNLAPEKLDMAPEVLVALIAGGIMTDPLYSQVRAINRRLTNADAKSSSTVDSELLKQFAVTDGRISLITAFQMSEFSQTELLDVNNGLLVTIEKLLLALNDKTAIGLILIDDNATLTDELLTVISSRVDTIQAGLGSEKRLIVARSSSDDRSLKRVMESMRMKLMKEVIRETGARITQMGFMGKGYAELFATTAPIEAEFSELIRTNASPLTDQSKIFGAQLKKENLIADLIAGMLFAMLQASKTPTNEGEVNAKADALKYNLERMKIGTGTGFTDITDVIAGVLVELIAAVRAEIRTSQAA